MTFRAALSRFLACRPIAFIGRHPVAISNLTLWALELWTHQWDGQAVANHHATLTAVVSVVTKLGRKWLPTVMPVDVAGKEVVTGLWSEFHPAVVCDDENVTPTCKDHLQVEPVVKDSLTTQPAPQEQIHAPISDYLPDAHEHLVVVDMSDFLAMCRADLQPAKKRQARAKAKKHR